MNTNVHPLNASLGQPPAMGARKVDTTRGTNSGVLSSQWYQRPDDQRFTSMTELGDFVRARSARSHHQIIDTKSMRVRGDRDDQHKMSIILPGDLPEVTPNHWSFGQICRHIGAPADYLRKIPSGIAQFNLNYGLATYEQEDLKPYWQVDPETGAGELRAMTSPTYGRIMDDEVVDAIEKIAPDGSGWKVPGTMNWGSGIYDPNTPISKQSTTLYASDRDLFVFLCRDQHPIEIGLLADGSPDLLFPSFIVSNSEVGSASLRIEVMYIRAVCQNRNIWGIENRRTMTIRHTSGAPSRFLREAEPALLQFADEATMPVIAKVNAAKALVLATNDDERMTFLRKQEVSKTAARSILDEFEAFEGRPAESAFDFVQAITLKARDVGHQDARIEMERAAGKLMDLAA